MAAHQQTDKPIEDEKTERVAKKKEKIGSTRVSPVCTCTRGTVPRTRGCTGDRILVDYRVAIQRKLLPFFTGAGGGNRRAPPTDHAIHADPAGQARSGLSVDLLSAVPRIANNDEGRDRQS